MNKADLNELMPLVERELHRVAAKYLRRERANHTLQPTALVNEAFLALSQQKNPEWESRGHFLAVAALVMRQILVDYARQRRAEKRGGGRVQVTYAEDALAQPTQAGDDVLALDEALLELKQQNPRQAQIVELRYFGGMSVEETAEFLGVSSRTVKRDWMVARAWLFEKLHGAGDAER